MEETLTLLPDVVDPEPLRPDVVEPEPQRRRALTAISETDEADEADSRWPSDSDSGFDDTSSISAGPFGSLPVATTTACQQDESATPAAPPNLLESALPVPTQSSAAALHRQPPIPAQRSVCGTAVAGVFSELLQKRQRTRPAAGGGDTPPRTLSPQPMRSDDDRSGDSNRQSPQPKCTPLTAHPVAESAVAAPVHPATSNPGNTTAMPTAPRPSARPSAQESMGQRPARRSLRTALKQALRKAWMCQPPARAQAHPHTHASTRACQRIRARTHTFARASTHRRGGGVMASRLACAINVPHFTRNRCRLALCTQRCSSPNRCCRGSATERAVMLPNAAPPFAPRAS